MYLFRSMTNLSLASIREAFGDRNLSVIMRGIEIEHVNNEVWQNADYQRTIDVLKAKIEQHALNQAKSTLETNS